MNRHVPLHTILTSANWRVQSKVEDRPFPFWPLLLLVAVIAYVVVTSADSPLTPDQHIALFLDSAMSP